MSIRHVLRQKRAEDWKEADELGFIESTVPDSNGDVTRQGGHMTLQYVPAIHLGKGGSLPSIFYSQPWSLKSGDAWSPTSNNLSMRRHPDDDEKQLESTKQYSILGIYHMLTRESLVNMTVSCHVRISDILP